MAVSDLQKQYVKKHQQEKTDAVTVRPQKGTKERWREAASSKGVSLQRFVIDAVNKAADSVLEPNNDQSEP